jgi:hypothetical protein
MKFIEHASVSKRQLNAIESLPSIRRMYKGNKRVREGILLALALTHYHTNEL